GPLGSGPGFPGAGAPAAVSDSQITAGLVELSLYGVVSLYEKYGDAPKAGDPSGTPAVPPKDPTPPVVPPKGVVPPKQRRRRM
ncbi:MAG: hypothetical protein ACKODX_08195, partial [Gemmata sp.]